MIRVQSADADQTRAIPISRPENVDSEVATEQLNARGKTGGGVDTRLKDSWDIGISEVDGWQDAEALLNQTMLAALMRYVRKYAHVALAPLSLRWRRKNPTVG